MNPEFRRKARIERTFYSLFQRRPAEEGIPGIHVVMDTDDDTLEKVRDIIERDTLCALCPELYARHKMNPDSLRHF